MLLEVGHDAAGDVHGHGAAALGALGGVLDVPLHGHAGHAEEVAEELELPLVVGDVGLGHHRERRTVGDELLAVAVEDAPARGSRGARAVALGLARVLVVGHELHRPHAGEQDRHDTAGEQAEAAEPRLEARLGRSVVPAGRTGRLAADVHGEAAAVGMDHQDDGHDGNHDDDGADYEDDGSEIHLSPPDGS